MPQNISGAISGAKELLGYASLAALKYPMFKIKLFKGQVPTLVGGIFEVEMPADGRVVHIEVSGLTMTLHVIADSQSSNTSRKFFQVQADTEIPVKYANAEYVGTYLRGENDRRYVFEDQPTEKGHRFFPAHG